MLSYCIVGYFVYQFTTASFVIDTKILGNLGINRFN